MTAARSKQPDAEPAPTLSHARVKSAPIVAVEAEHEDDRPTLVPELDALEARVLFETRAVEQRRLAALEQNQPTRRLVARSTLRGLEAPPREPIEREPGPSAEAPRSVVRDAPAPAPATPERLRVPHGIVLLAIVWIAVALAGAAVALR